jgi:hypothetical protein
MANPGALCWLLLCLLTSVGSAWAQDNAAQALHAGFAAARAQASHQLSDRPVYLQSTERADQMQGEVYALVDLPYAGLRAVLPLAEPWCGILILHLNLQYCRASGSAGKEVLDAGIGRKFEQPLADLYWVRFGLDVLHRGDDYLQVALQAPTGPLGTTDYAIAVEALPFDAGRSLLHLRYSYRFGLAARWALQAYLVTTGSDKVGFSVVDRRADGQVTRVGGVRGVLERNTMRYFLAIESYLGAQAQPQAARTEKALQDWFSATERYPLQLHEIERDAYITMKRRALQRQSVEAVPPSAR